MVRSRLLLLALVVCSTAPLFAVDPTVTHCRTETIRIAGDASTPPDAAWDVRRLIACSDSESDDTLWHLDRLDSGSGQLDGRFVRPRVNALVYVMDVGVEIDHDEFADGNVISGIDMQHELGEKSYCPESSNPALHPCYKPTGPIYFAGFSHGTGVASILGGRNVGVAPGVSMVSVSIFTSATPETKSWVAAMKAVIRHAWDPATPQFRTIIINMSAQLHDTTAAGDISHDVLEQKIRDMIGGVDRDGNPDPNGKRFLFVVSAGNAAPPVKEGGPRGGCGPNYEVRSFPATLGPSLDGLITVGGTTRDNRLWSDSCRGPLVELLAPAENVFPATNSGKDHYRLTLSSGTSYSAPIVSGAAARILSQFPDLTPAELERRLESTPSYVSDAPADTAAGGRMVYIADPAPRRRTLR